MADMKLSKAQKGILLAMLGGADITRYDCEPTKPFLFKAGWAKEQLVRMSSVRILENFGLIQTHEDHMLAANMWVLTAEGHRVARTFTQRDTAVESVG